MNQNGVVRKLCSGSKRQRDERGCYGHPTVRALDGVAHRRSRLSVLNFMLTNEARSERPRSTAILMQGYGMTVC